MRNDTAEAVGQHTCERAHEEDGAEHDEEDHQGGPEDGVDLGHDVKADVARTEKDLCEEPRHLTKRVRRPADEGEGGEEPAVNDDYQNHELDEILSHLLEAWDQG